MTRGDATLRRFSGSGLIPIVAVGLILLLPAPMAFPESAHTDKLEVARLAYERVRAASRPDQLSIATASRNYAEQLEAHGDILKAAALYNRAAVSFERAGSQYAERQAAALIARGDLVSTRDASVDYSNALRAVAKKHGKDSAPYIDTQTKVGARLLYVHRAGKAQHHIHKAYKRAQRALAVGDPARARAEIMRGEYAIGRGLFDAAAGYFQQALAGFDAAGPEFSDEAIRVRRLLVFSYTAAGEHDAATSHCEQIGRYVAASRTEDSAPVAIVSATPRYPNMAYITRKEGRVALRFNVDPSGRVADVVVTEAPEDTSLADSAKTALARYRFAPRFVEGNPVSTVGVEAEYVFEIGRPRCKMCLHMAGRQDVRSLPFDKPDWLLGGDPIFVNLPPR